ncbi:MAG: anaerobic sulfatase maturase, partial [Candidatus Thorarchaeota archaeon]
CNLRCQYCFYIDHLETVENQPRMSEDILESMIAGYMQTNQNNSYAFGWQGGEPTMMGLKFFKKVVELQTKYAPPNAVISNGLQTNGTLITNDMAEFFAEYRFLIGVSLDGPEYLHDFYRKTIGLKGTHSQVLRGINHLRKHNVEFNILSLVNNKTVKRASEIYHYLKDQGFFYHQYIPCVEFDEQGNLKQFSITGEDWGDFLCDLFDEWIKEDTNKVSIRLFDSIINYLVLGNYSICYMDNNCCQYFVVEYQGNIYPCDFFVRNSLLLGNVKTHNWIDILNSETYQTFGAQKTQINNRCNDCPFINFCHGDCQKHRFNPLQNPKALSILCRGWKKFYVNTLPRFKAMANQIKNDGKLNSSFQFKAKKIGRNSLCPCLSGKKYKDCCFR